MEENPSLHCRVCDLPVVCDLAREIKKDVPHFDRITYHPCDTDAGDDFGGDYDIFFISHFLYHYKVNGELEDFLKKVNRALKPGGLIVSHHISTAESREDRLTMSLVELMTRVMGYPTHQLPVETLKNALVEAGFGRFKVADTGRQAAFPATLLGARKL
jgi:2-polyprenyl-3-methyl-5-hydroxy-6-metoxy-1,4-benzoquinol methylase